MDHIVCNKNGAGDGIFRRPRWMSRRAPGMRQRAAIRGYRARFICRAVSVFAGARRSMSAGCESFALSGERRP